MPLETQLQELITAVRDLTRAIVRDSVVRTDIWRESTREALRVFPLSQVEIDELTGKTSPDGSAEPGPVTEPVASAEPEAAPEPEVTAPSPEDVMALGRQLVASGLKTMLSDILIEVGGKQVKGLEGPQRAEFSRLARKALERQVDQADAA